LDDFREVVEHLGWDGSSVTIECSRDYIATDADDLKEVPAESLKNVEISRNKPYMLVDLSDHRARIVCMSPDPPAFRAAELIGAILQKRKLRRIPASMWVLLQGCFTGLAFAGSVAVIALTIKNWGQLSWVSATPALTVIPYLMGKRRYSAVIKRESHERKPFITKWNAELTLFFTVLSVVVAIVIAVVTEG
jgi:hypothetical protein